jgi:hypothetical protein
MAEKIQRHTGDLPQFAKDGDRTTFGTGIEDDSLDGNLNPQFSGGWQADPNVLPPAQHFNAVNYTTTRLLGYLFQSGIPEYNAQQTYFIGNICKNANGLLFTSLTDNNLNNPLDDGVNWKSTVSELTPDNFATYYSDGTIANIYGGLYQAPTENILMFKKDGTPSYQRMPFGRGYHLVEYTSAERQINTLYTNPYNTPIIVYINFDAVGINIRTDFIDGVRDTDGNEILTPFTNVLGDVGHTIIVPPGGQYLIHQPFEDLHELVPA